MKQLKKIALIGTLLLTSATAFAAPGDPVQCPSAQSITAYGLHSVGSLPFGYSLSATNSYGTAQHWTFVFPLDGTFLMYTPAQALKIGNGILQEDLKLESQTPTQINGSTQLQCTYVIKGCIKATAISARTDIG